MSDKETVANNCEICFKILSSKQRLTPHMRIHTVELKIADVITMFV